MGCRKVMPVNLATLQMAVMTGFLLEMDWGRHEIFLEIHIGQYAQIRNFQAGNVDSF